MAMQNIRTSEQQNQPGRGQAMERSPRQGRYGLGLPLTPGEFFRMSPFALMGRMTEELERLMSGGAGREQSERVWAPAIEVTQRDGTYVVRAELPGLRPEDVKLEVTDDAIVMQGERKWEHEEDKGGMHVTERRYGRFYRAIPLPEGAKTDDVRAKFENGVSRSPCQPRNKRARATRSRFKLVHRRVHKGRRPALVEKQEAHPKRGAAPRRSPSGPSKSKGATHNIGPPSAGQFPSSCLNPF